MKVKIGPYKNFFGPYQLAEKLMFWLPKEADEVFKFGERLSEITWLDNLLNWIESKKKRTVKVHIDKYDTWNMDSTLALIVHPMLKQLRQSKHGSCFVDDEDVPDELRSTSCAPAENEYDTDDNFFKRWDWVMGEMVWAFEQKNIDWDDQYQSGEIDCEFGQNGIIYGENHTFKLECEGMKKHQDRMKNGFRLFGKYYEGLWD